MRLLAGTSGFSYKEWLGSFYPEKLPADEMLRYYAARFTTVEINNTFYRMPAEAMLARWAQDVPASFEFTLKAPRRITHDKRLREATPDVTEFLRRSVALGARLGAFILQADALRGCWRCMHSSAPGFHLSPAGRRGGAKPRATSRLRIER